MKIIKVQIGPQFKRPVTTNLPTRDDALYKAKREITHLRNEITRLESRNRRLVEDIQFEVQGWEQALRTGQRQESLESLKRRISRLKGALNYQGIIDYEEAKER